MPERDKTHHIDLGPQPIPPVRWNVEGMAQTLGAQTFDVVHDLPSFGLGKRLELEGSETVLEMWESVGFVSAESRRGRAEAIGVQPTDITEEFVVFMGSHDEGATRLSVSRDGMVHYVFVPKEPLQADAASSPHHQPLTEDSSGSAEPAQYLLTDPAKVAFTSAAVEAEASEGAAADAAEEPLEGVGEREKSNRVEIAGNVSWEPKFREFQSGNARLQFDVAVHNEDGSTEYKRVKAFKDRARRYNGQIHKGDYVRLVGGKAHETVEIKGKQQEREFIILWGLKPLSR